MDEIRASAAGVERVPSDEPGLSAFEVEDGASLLFPWLEDD